MKRIWIAVLCAVLVAACVAIPLILNGNTPDEGKTTVQQTPLPTAESAADEPAEYIVTQFSPTCTSAGYTLYENPEDGSTRVVDGMPPLGHLFIDDGQTYICEVCGYTLVRSIAEAADIPRIDLTGSTDGISKDTRIPLRFEYTAPDLSFSCYASTSWQGHDSLAYEKKNYTIRLYDDAEFTEKHRLTFDGWLPEHKYVLKANYLDPTCMRNLYAADIWSMMVQARSNVPAQLLATSNYGAVDGFPVQVWLNGEFHGLYTLNLHKDDDLYNMGGNRREAVMISNAQTMPESLFMAEAVFDEDASDWELEYCGTEFDTEWAKESLNELIRFVMTSDDATFRSELHKYLDVDGAIDYLIFIYAMGLQEAGARDLVLIRYEDTVWIPTVYDMECALGLDADNAVYLSPDDSDVFVPLFIDGSWHSGTGSLLWDRFFNLFLDEIKARYVELRGGVLSNQTMIDALYARRDSVPAELMEMDLELYSARTLPEYNPWYQMAEYIDARLTSLDMLFTPQIFLEE